MANTALKYRQVDELTDGQRQCLRLVLAHKTSKQIALDLGLSHHTVDQRLRFAIKTLGVQNRTEAALMLAEAEENHDYRSWSMSTPSFQKSSIPPLVSPVAIDPAMDMDYDEVLARDAEKQPHTLHDYQSNSTVANMFQQNPPFLPGIDLKTIRKNTMSTYARLGAIAALSALSILIFAVTISSLNSLSALYH